MVLCMELRNVQERRMAARKAVEYYGGYMSGGGLGGVCPPPEWWGAPLPPAPWSGIHVYLKILQTNEGITSMKSSTESIPFKHSVVRLYTDLC